MATVHAGSERLIAAPADRVNAMLADYRERPKLLPPNFLDYRVEQGGMGAGTEVSYRLRTGRRERAYRMQVSEPSPGRSLVERDAGSSLVTTWTLEPSGAGSTRVRVDSEWQGAGGVGGFFERTFAPPALRRIYDQMLERLEQAVTAPAA